jgi:hypothetical protein
VWVCVLEREVGKGRAGLVLLYVCAS